MSIRLLEINDEIITGLNIIFILLFLLYYIYLLYS